MNEKAYTDLLKRVLVGYHIDLLYEYKPLTYISTWKMKILKVFEVVLRNYDYAICKLQRCSTRDRIKGNIWPAMADTMIGLERLNNIEYCINRVFKNNIPGDFIETGVSL